MKTYEYSGKLDYLTAVLAASGAVISGGVLGLAHGGLTGIHPYSQILWDFFAIFLVGGSQGKAIEYAIRSARIRNASAAGLITLLGTSATIYCCWVGWFTKRAGRWVWKPVDLLQQMEAALAAYPNAVIPAYWFWLLIAGGVAAMIVTNNKWNRLGFCETCEQWCTEALTLGPGHWPPPTMNDAADLVDAVAAPPKGKKYIVVRLGGCPQCDFAVAEVLKVESMGKHTKQLNLFQIEPEFWREFTDQLMASTPPDAETTSSGP